MKKIIAVLLAVLFVCGALAACGGNSGNTDETKAADNGETQAAADADFKAGVVLVGDENEGYTFAHMEGIKEAAKELGIADVNKYIKDSGINLPTSNDGRVSKILTGEEESFLIF